MNNHPCKCCWHNDETTILADPVSFAGASCLAEKKHSNLLQPLSIRITTSMPTQEYLLAMTVKAVMALNASPLWGYHHSCTGNNWSDTYKSYLDIATTPDCHIYCQWILDHVGVSPNEEANDFARLCVDTYPADIQNTISIELEALKPTLKQCLKQQWIQCTPLLGLQYQTCLQTTTISIEQMSRTRFLQPCKHYIPDGMWAKSRAVVFTHKACNWKQILNADFVDTHVKKWFTSKGEPSNCPVTTAFWIDHGISFDTLVNETPENILLIAHFDAFIWHILGCDHWTSNPS